MSNFDRELHTHQLRSGHRFPARMMEGRDPPVRMPGFRAGEGGTISRGNQGGDREEERGVHGEQQSSSACDSPAERSGGRPVGSGSRRGNPDLGGDDQHEDRRSQKGGEDHREERRSQRGEEDQREERRSLRGGDDQSVERRSQRGKEAYHGFSAGGYEAMEDGRAGRPAGSGEGGNTSWGTGRSMSTTPPKIEVPDRFSGAPGEEPTLKNYLMMIEDIRYCWDRERLDPIEFFRGLGRTLKGEALTHYRVERQGLLMRSNRGDILPADITDRFLESLQEQFPGHSADRMAEFQDFRRAPAESMLAYYNRLLELAEDMGCVEERILVTKFVNGLDGDLIRDMRSRLYSLGVRAKLRQVYQVAKEVEDGKRFFEGMRGSSSSRPSERRRPAWAAVEGRQGEEERRERPSEDRRRCYKCGEKGHVRKDCAIDIVCDTCKMKGHFRRDCPKAPICTGCGKRGHTEDRCYSKGERMRGKSARELQLEREVAKLKGQLEKTEISEDPEKALLAWEDDEEEEYEREEAEYGAMAIPPRDREELGLRSGGKDGRTEQKQPERRTPRQQEESHKPRTARRHPEERLVCQPTALVVEPKAVAVRGILVENAVVDTGAQSVLLGRKLTEQLREKGDLEIVNRGILIMTAEGGAPKWMPCTKDPIEITLQPGEKGETTIRVQCGLTESEDYDVLLGMELLFKIGTTICTWQEQVLYRSDFWIEGKELSELPVRFVKTEPKKAWRAEGMRRESVRRGSTKEGKVGANLNQYSVTLVELFGGLGAGLVAALEAGLKVKRWVYVEIDPEVRRMAWKHAQILQQRYPAQLAKEVIREAMQNEKWDVGQLTKEDVNRWGKVDLLVAGWECQGTSRAGKGRGMQDDRTAMVTTLLTIMRWARESGGEYAYILEHVDMRSDSREPVRAVRELVEAELGRGVSCDGAQLGARCHRVRQYWQNVLPEGELRARLARVERDESRIVEDILEPGRVAAPVVKPDHPRQYQCNRVGEARRAWPTLVAYAKARGFVEVEGTPGPGMVYDHRKKRWEEPTALERELAMGYLPGATAADGVGEEVRKAALGRAIDQHSLRWLISEMRKGPAEKKGKTEEEKCRGSKQAAYAAVSKLTDEKEIKTAPPVGTEAEPGKTWELGAGIGEQAAEAIREVLQQHRGTFAYNLQELGRYKGRELELNLTTELPTYQRRRRMNAEDAAICKEKCEELLAAGIIRPSESSYAAATVVAARKDITGKILAKRMCGDFRELNKITSPDRYPMPTAEDIFDRLEGATVFTTLDLRQGFNQIGIREADKRKTAFHGVDGLYEYNVMPFGLRNAPAVFQRAMDQVLKGVPAAACYIDDVLIYSSSKEQHVQDLKQTLEAIAAAGLTCHPDKCKIARHTVAYLGFEVKGGRLAIQEAKVKVLENLAAPKDKTGLRALLGFLNYYRKFVSNFSRRAYVLNQLLREGKSWQWGEVEEAARQDLLEAVRTGTLLQIPRAEAPFILYTDWSSTGMGAVLCQEIEGEERVIAFASRSCSPSEANYCSYEGEGLTAVWGITHFKVYLQGRHFTLVTDHQPLLWLMTNQELTGRNARWAIKLLGFDFEIRHRPGKTLQHADGLSRNPPPMQPVAQLAALAHTVAVSWGQEKGEKRLADIWEDEETMSWIKGEPLEEEGVSERARARGQHYRWFQEQLQLRTSEGWRVVPQPQERNRIMGKVHAKLGHYGITRTRQLLSTMYWWASMGKDVAGLVASCEACQRNKARLEKEREELHSLPIRGLGYRWSLDLAGELPLSKGGKQYILIMVEHTSKWVEARALPSKSSALIADAFEELVLTRYGACGEVLTDQGTEFQGSFDELLEEMGITHRVTSRYHPQSDGLTERLIQTVKKGLRAYGETHKRSWDRDLWWVLAGYRFAKQAALKHLSPYHLLYGRDPVLPVDAPKLLSATIEADEPSLWAGLAEKRARYLKELTPAALDNLHVAQLRDARRYQQRKAGGMGGKSHQVEAGQEVYLRRAKRDTLDLAVGPERWRVKEVRESGVLVLEDDRGEYLKEHITNVARAGREKPQALDPVSGAARVRAQSREGAGKPEIRGGDQNRVITYARRKKG